MAEHFIHKCKHGVVVTQCRCLDSNKTVTIVEHAPNCPECLAGAAKSHSFAGVKVCEFTGVEPRYSKREEDGP